MNRAYWTEIKYEFIKQSRMRMYVFSAFLFPLAFYTVFGILLGFQRQTGMQDLPRNMMASYGSFGVIGVCLFGFGVGIAVERGLGWLEVKRASPMPPLAYLLAKTAAAMAFSGILLLLLFTLAFTAGGVRMPALQWAQLWIALVAGSAPFCAMGLALGSFLGPNSAPALINAVYLPMAFCSGLWMPLQFLPRAVQHIAPFLPAYHLGQIANSILAGSGGAAVPQHVEALAGFGCLFAGVAWIAYSRERAKMYG